MIIVKSPFRISFFGGSTDYEYFYKTHGSFIIGTTIDKYVYLSIRKRPIIFPKESVLTYSKYETVKSINEIQNSLIRTIFKFENINYPIEFNSYSDVPSRTGLGGSSTFCVGLINLLKILNNKSISKKNLAKEAIYVERIILKESGGVQDQIWASYGGFNSIEIKKSGDFYVKPIPVSDEFTKEFQKSILLVYTNNQRDQDNIAKSHENKNKENILIIARQAYQYFIDENIKQIGNLLHQSWKEKKQISNLISNDNVNEIENISMNNGAYGVKLLGAGGCGFVVIICNPRCKKKLKEIFKYNILDIKFSNFGTSRIY